MNKTVLLACCDFLILATLALTPVNLSTPAETEEVLVPDSQFQIDETEKVPDDITENLYESRLEELSNKLAGYENQLNEHKKLLGLKDQEIENKNNQIKKLTLDMAGNQTPVFKKVLDNRWQINISMKEDDSFSPDFFSKSFFSCAFEMNDRVFLVSEFEQMGFTWSELINDGNISKLTLTLAKTGENPWSASCKGPVYSMNQDAALILIEAPKNRVYEPLKVLPYSKLVSSLEKLYAAKSDGRIIKIKNASIIPNDPNWLVVDEERFLGHPDKVDKGDVIITEGGCLVGAITRRSGTGNATRFKAFIFDRLDANEKEDIPLKKSSTNVYYSEFVKKAKKVFGIISAEVK